MIEIEFKINDRKVSPNNIGNQLEKAMLSQIRDNIVNKLKGLRDPKTGKQPKLTVQGRSLNDLSFEVSGSPELIEEVKRRLT